MKVLLISSASFLATVKSDSVISKRLAFALIDDITFLVYLWMEVVSQDTMLRKETDQNLKRVKCTYKKHLDRHITQPSIFRERAEVYFDWLPLSHSAAERWAAEM